MGIGIRTELLQKMVNKAIQGSSNNKALPLTSLIGIEFKGRVLSLYTTDGSNQLIVKHAFRDQELPEILQEFYTIVNADTFSKLVGKTTKETIELENKDNYLEFKGNGVNKFDIAINEDGEIVRFKAQEKIDAEPFSIDTKLLQGAIKVAKASIAKTMDVPCLTGYYICDNIITTDRQLVCKLNYGLCKEPLLLPSEMAELLLLAERETINVLHKDNKLMFFDEDFVLCGNELEGKEIYPVQPINNLVSLDYKSEISVKKQELLNVLDRMALFVSDRDENGIILTFASGTLQITSKKSNANEIIVSDTQGNLDFECLVDIQMLKSQVETISTDMVQISYGQDKSIKIQDGYVTHVISLIEKTN